MKKGFLSLMGALITFVSTSQVTLYSEDFESGGASITTNAADLGGGTVVNTWLINNSYIGGSGTFICLGFPFSFSVPNFPSQPGGITASPNSTYMHVTAQPAIASGITCGSYFAADGICSVDETNFSKMTAPISTVGYTGVALDFWWVCGGSPTAYGEVYYSLDGGTTWTLKQAPYNNSITWTQAPTLTDVAWDNAASVQFGFNFINLTAATAADPGFALDDIVVTGTAAATNSITTDPLAVSGWCEGITTPITVGFSATGTYNAGNVYSAQLSDGSGSFAAPTVIGTLASSASGSLSISATISGATPAGAGYRIRVVASDPATTGSDNGSDIEIYTLPTVTQTTFFDLCITFPPMALSGGSPGGGTYSGTGVSAGSFDPAAAGLGSHNITYAYTDGNGCSNTATEPIVVNDIPTVTQTTFVDVCINGAPVTLSGGSPGGGTYSGTGVATGSFDPATAGLGSHNITYSYTDGNGCSNTAIEPIVVNDLPTVTQTTFIDVCLSAAPITLTGGSPAGGTYSGTGVTGGSFDPTGAGAGSHDITYTYTDGNGCSNSAIEPFVVYDLPMVTQAVFVDVCLNVAPVTLIGGSPSGGTYSGTGVAAGSFDPAVAGFGSHNVMYTYTDANGCSNSATEAILVNDVPTVTLGAFANVCVFESDFALTGGLPLGGTFSGPGVTTGDFDPATAGAGTHTITYSYTDASTSCTNTATQTILVDNCAGISENDAANVLLSPNPTETSFTIASDLVIDQIILTDMNGRIVKTFGNQNSYNVAELNGGMYMVHISAGGLNLVKRLMVH